MICEFSAATMHGVKAKSQKIPNYNCARCTCCTRCLSHAGMNRQVAQVLQPFALQPLPEGPVAGGVLHSLKSARASAAGMG